MANRKVKKDFWEQLFKYPSFNHRFGFTVSLILLFFIGITIAIFKLKIISGVSDQISALNLIVQKERDDDESLSELDISKISDEISKKNEQ